MVSSSSATLDAAFQALAHPTRRAMVALLARGERTVGELAAPFEISLPASSKHLRVLERAGLVRRRVRGRTHTCSLEAEPLRQVVDWAQEYRAFWEERLDQLDAYLQELKTQEKPRPPGGPTTRA